MKYTVLINSTILFYNHLLLVSDRRADCCRLECLGESSMLGMLLSNTLLLHVLSHLNLIRRRVFQILLEIICHQT